MMSKKLLNVTIAYLTALSVFVTPLSAYANINSNRPTTEDAPLTETERKEFLSNIQTAYSRQLEFHHPYLMDISKAELPAGWTPGFKGPQNFVDQDPFFMRSQSWSATNEKSPKEGFSFAKDSNGHLTLRESTWNKTLTIKEQITSIFETTEYIILSVDKDNDLFERKMGNDPERGEGVFFINKADFYIEAKRTDSKAIPVFFFPLPETGWKGIKEGFEWRTTNQNILVNESKAALPIDLIDFNMIEKIERNHLKYAQVLAAYELSPEERMTMMQSGQMPLPLPGTTAGFGLFWTAKSPSKIASAKNHFPKKLYTQIQNFILPQANADLMEMAGSLLTPDLMNRVSFLMQIMGGAFVGAMGLKYTVYWTKFKEKYPLADVINDTNKATGFFTLPIRLMAREAKGIFDVYSHVLSAMINGTAALSINSVEFLLDRYLTSSAGPSNGLVRKIFNNTLGWSRAQIDKLAMNWKTFWLGVGVLGSIDCALVVVQLLFVTPMLLEAMGLGAVLAGSAVSTMITAEIIRNFVGYWMNGSFSYSSEQKYFVQTEVEQMVNNRLRAQGFDPESKEVRGRKEKMIEEMLDKKMTQMGLPSKDEFLFDANTIIKDTTALLGYGVKKETKEKLKDSHGSFLFEKGRQGLVKPTLNKAIETAERINKENPSVVGEETIQILKEAKSQYGFVWNFIMGTARVFQSDEPIVKQRAEEFKGGAGKYLLNFSRDLVKAISRETIEKTRAIRQALTISSYSGDLKEVVDELPGQWKELGKGKNPDAYYYAAKLYNSSLASITEGDADLANPSAATKAKYLATAEKVIGEQKDAMATEIAKIETMVHLKKIDKEQAEIKAFNPQSEQSFIQRNQLTWVRKVTEQEMIRQFGDNKNWTQEDYQKIFSKNLAKKVGLIVEDVENSKFVQEVYAKANEITADDLKQSTHQAYMKELDEMDKAAYQANIFSTHFIDTYVQYSTMTDQHLPAESTEQPGRFQSLRKKIVGMKGEKYIRGMIRVAEGFFSDDQYKTGATAYLKRNIPVLPDLWKNIVRKARTAPYFMMFGYFATYYIWQQQQDYGIYLMGLSLFPFLNTIGEVYNRVNRMLGIKPMGDTWSKAKWAFIWSWIGYPLFIPQTLLAGPSKEAFDSGIRQPVLSGLRRCADALR